MYHSFIFYLLFYGKNSSSRCCFDVFCDGWAVLASRATIGRQRYPFGLYGGVGLHPYSYTRLVLGHLNGVCAYSTTTHDKYTRHAI